MLATKRRRLEKPESQPAPSQQQQTAVVSTKASQVLGIQSLLRLILEFVSHYVDHRRDGRIRVNSHFKSACSSSQLMRVVDLRGVEIIPKSVCGWFANGEHTVVRELHLSNCNIAGFMRANCKLAFPNLEFVTLENCNIGKKRTRRTKLDRWETGKKRTPKHQNRHAIIFNPTREWLRHDRPRLQLVNLSGTTFLSVLGILFG